MPELRWHPYRYFPYERELARREVAALFPDAPWSPTEKGLTLRGHLDLEIARRLVYFADVTNGDGVMPTLQSQLEMSNGKRSGRQATRYSAHGLHEYKGKFNPQIVRAMLNILNVPVGSRVIDPFCGSGTSLLESALLGMNAIGADINPFAVFIANAKLTAALTPAHDLRSQLSAALDRAKRADTPSRRKDEPREAYLRKWFTPEVLEDIERLRCAIGDVNDPAAAPLFAIASNLLRDFSLQDPNDLRIRRRKTPLPTKRFAIAFEEAAQVFIDRLSSAQQVVPAPAAVSHAVLADSRNLTSDVLGVAGGFDCALTSPPYATALPYIDTQRLSLVWLGLIPPEEILPLESRLIGSREVRGGRSKQVLLDELHDNGANLPAPQAAYCAMLQSALGDGDGFRRQAVPSLLYRYFVGMRDAFNSLRPRMNAGAPYALVVGTNHTVLGGRRFDIDTPQHLADLAMSCGWSHAETIPLQTYQRYGYHVGNAVSGEAMVILRAT